MSTVKVAKTYADPEHPAGCRRWYVWTREAGGRKRTRLETYLYQAVKAGRAVHADNVLKQALNGGYKNAGRIDINRPRGGCTAHNR